MWAELRRWYWRRQIQKHPPDRLALPPADGDRVLEGEIVDDTELGRLMSVQLDRLEAAWRAQHLSVEADSRDRIAAAQRARIRRRGRF